MQHLQSMDVPVHTNSHGEHYIVDDHGLSNQQSIQLHNIVDLEQGFTDSLTRTF